MIIVIMITAAVLSAFMNNIGVAALMLPVVIEVARRTRIPVSRLLMPLAYATLLGGLTTLIGTPPNLLVSEALTIPTIGIGASKHCDGQILVTDDLLGLSNLTSRFVKKYSNLKGKINKSIL